MPSRGSTAPFCAPRSEAAIAVYPASASRSMGGGTAGPVSPPGTRTGLTAGRRGEMERPERSHRGCANHGLLWYCDNADEPLAGMMRKGSAGSNTTADHIEVTDASVAALPPAFRRRLMVTCDGAGASHGLIAHLDKLASRPGYQLIYSVGWELGEREKAAITQVPDQA